MARTRYGSITGNTSARQPGSELIYHDSGLIEGQYIIKADEANTLLTRYIGSAHPDDSAVQLYAMRIVYDRLGIRMAVYDCIGITRDPTDRVPSYMAANSTDPIETHPYFRTRAGGTALAGTIASPKNGATFDPETKQFLGWMADACPADLIGVRSYYRNAMVVRATWFSFQPPRFRYDARITAAPPGVPDIAGVKDWLEMAPSGEKVGTLFRISQEYIGSDNRGWSKKIYGNG